ncbi:uncharacterized protein LOC125500067 isoform X3 [Athalia rosae]|uniref:uncharacterized protein LOC125500067 isoform X3 n=1 Tax=Athalia rosae TaxID=37344 RepID=UPI0020347169|nr:uncharacterized protein LOC125500067 isoform X3 [Athalia rosae]
MNCKFDVFVMRGRRNNGGSARNTFGRRCEVQGSSSDAVDWTWLFRAYIGQPPPWRIGRPQDSAWTQEVHGALAKSIFASRTGPRKEARGGRCLGSPSGEEVVTH